MSADVILTPRMCLARSFRRAALSQCCSARAETGCDSGHVKRTSNGLSRCYHAPPAGKVEEAPEDE